VSNYKIDLPRTFKQRSTGSGCCYTIQHAVNALYRPTVCELNILGRTPTRLADGYKIHFVYRPIRCTDCCPE